MSERDVAMIIMTMLLAGLLFILLALWGIV